MAALAHGLFQLCDGFVVGRPLVEGLLEVGVDGGVLGDGFVGFGIGSFLVFADFEEELDFGVFGEERAELAGCHLVILRNDGGLAAGDGGEDVDRRIVVLLRELAREDDVAVEDGARFVGDRLGHVVALDKDGVESRDGALGRVASALHQLGELGEHGGREAAAGGRLAGGKADFALGASEARDAVHEEQHLASLVAEVLGDGRGDVGGLEALHGGAVGGGDDEDRLLQSFGAEVLLDELAHLAAALADEREDGDLGLGVADDLREEGGLAAAGGGEDAHALSFAAGEKAVDGADAERDGRGDDAALKGGGRRGVDGVVAIGTERAASVGVHGAAETVKDAAEEVMADGDHLDAARGDDLGLGGDADHLAEGGEKNGITREADDLGLDLEVLPGVAENAHFAHLDARDGRLDDGADDLDHLALHVDGLGVLDGAVEYLGDVVEGAGHGR